MRVYLIFIVSISFLVISYVLMIFNKEEVPKEWGSWVYPKYRLAKWLENMHKKIKLFSTLKIDCFHFWFFALTLFLTIFSLAVMIVDFCTNNYISKSIGDFNLAVITIVMISFSLLCIVFVETLFYIANTKYDRDKRKISDEEVKNIIKVIQNPTAIQDISFSQDNELEMMKLPHYFDFMDVLSYFKKDKTYLKLETICASLDYEINLRYGKINKYKQNGYYIEIFIESKKAKMGVLSLSYKEGFLTSHQELIIPKKEDNSSFIKEGFTNLINDISKMMDCLLSGIFTIEFNDNEIEEVSKELKPNDYIIINDYKANGSRRINIKINHNNDLSKYLHFDEVIMIDNKKGRVIALG